MKTPTHNSIEIRILKNVCLNNFSYYGCFQDSFSKQYEVCSKTIDALNDVILEKGDVVDVLDRTKSSHWLVRKDSAANEVSCNLYMYLYRILKPYIVHYKYYIIKLQMYVFYYLMKQI